jgi:hypothetical protein
MCHFHCSVSLVCLATVDLDAFEDFPFKCLRCTSFSTVIAKLTMTLLSTSICPMLFVPFNVLHFYLLSIMSFAYIFYFVLDAG